MDAARLLCEALEHEGVTLVNSRHHELDDVRIPREREVVDRAEAGVVLLVEEDDVRRELVEQPFAFEHRAQRLAQDRLERGANIRSGERDPAALESARQSRQCLLADARAVKHVAPQRLDSELTAQHVRDRCFDLSLCLRVEVVLRMDELVDSGTDTEINFQARVPTAKNAPISLYLRGGVDLRLAQLLSPDITSGGKVQFDIDSFGSRSDPNLQGQIRIIDASFATVDIPVGLQQANGVLTLTRDRLNVTQFQGKMGGGDVAASGGVIYRPDLRFDLGLKGKGVRILYNQSVRTTLSSNLSLSGNFSNAVLQGQVGIDDLSFTENFDLMDLMNQFGGEATPPPAEGFTQDLRLQIAINTPGGLNLTSRTLSVAGNANLQVHGTAAQPVLLGRLNLSSGDLIFSGNRYILQGGTIDFRNPSRTEPVLDMAVNTTIDQYDIQMRFWGPADHLHTNYASDPDPAASRRY